MDWQESLEWSQKEMNLLYDKNRVLSVGKLLDKISKNHELKVEISFMAGTAFPLNYLIIKGLGMEFDIKCYLEIGSYIGDCIYNMEDVCEKCISITAPLHEDCSMKGYCERFGFYNFSNWLVDKAKVTQYLVDSQKFDFSCIKEKPELVLIDGESTYQGVYNDTKNVQKIINADTIILWQILKRNPSSRKPYDNLILGMQEALGKDKWQNFYAFDNSSLGIYIPDKYQSWFSDCMFMEPDILYTYELDVSLHKHEGGQDR